MTAWDEDPLNEPTEQRRRLAALLHRLREQTGLDQTTFGARLRAGTGGINQSKVSRLERGRQIPTIVEAHAWADAANATGEQRDQLLERIEAASAEAASWTDELRRGFAAKQQRISGAEQAASVVRCYSVIVPGLLQTAEYARRLISMQAALQPGLFGDLSGAVTSWIDRQQVLYQPGGRFEFIVTEAALRWRPGPEGGRMMAAQLDHLRTLSALDTVRLGVIPWQADASVCAPHEFVILGDPGVDAAPEVVIYTTTRELHIRDEAQIAVYTELWRRLCDDALFDDDARGLLDGLAGALRAGTPPT